MVHTVASMAVTPSLAVRLARARAQFSQTPHFYRVAQVSRTCHFPERLSSLCRYYPGYAEREDAKAAVMLARAVGNSSVSVVSEALLERLFPGVLAKAHEIRWSDTRQPVWLANLCDLPGILWYVTHRRKLLEHGVQQVWILQHDIGWTGQLPSTLSLYSPHHDLLCEGLGEPPADWAHKDEANHPIAADGRWGCLLPATRYSVRLLDDQVRGLGEGKVSYCEMRAAMQCIGADWPCRMADVRGHGVLGSFSFYTAIAEEQLINATNRVLRSLPATLAPTQVSRRRKQGRSLLERQPSRSKAAKPHSGKKRSAATVAAAPAADVWLQVEPFTGRDLHRAHGVFVAAAADAKEERCRRQNRNDGGEYGRLYHRVMEPALQRGRFADCPMICPPDWSGFKEMEIAKKTGCVFNCIYNPSNFSDPEGKKRQAELERELWAKEDRGQASTNGR